MFGVYLVCLHSYPLLLFLIEIGKNKLLLCTMR